MARRQADEQRARVEALEQQLALVDLPAELEDTLQRAREDIGRQTTPRKRTKRSGSELVVGVGHVNYGESCAEE